MIIVMSPGATHLQIEHVLECVRAEGYRGFHSEGRERNVIGCVGSRRRAEPGVFASLGGVERVTILGSSYELCSRQFKGDDSVIELGHGVNVGGRTLVLMAGPCTVESIEQVDAVASAVAAAGARVIRGGVFKPRTSPYSFQGMGELGLRILRQAADRHDLPIVSEIMDQSQLGIMEEHVDLLQVGARNMQNFDLLKALGRSRRPVLLKRGLAATLEELLLAAEYILAGGNFNVILCERGIRTFENATRNTLNLSAIPVLKSLTHLPVVVDPSHSTGKRELVAPMARAAVAAGADGLLIEVHDHPEQALCDGAQSLLPEQLVSLSADLVRLADVVGRTFDAAKSAFEDRRARAEVCR